MELDEDVIPTQGEESIKDKIELFGKMLATEDNFVPIQTRTITLEAPHQFPLFAMPPSWFGQSRVDNVNEGSVSGSVPPYVDSSREQGVPTKKVEVSANLGQTITPRLVEKSVAPPMEYPMGVGGPTLGSTGVGMRSVVGVGTY